VHVASHLFKHGVTFAGFAAALLPALALVAKGLCGMMCSHSIRDALFLFAYLVAAAV
jgi:hypothetical protein